MVSPSYVFLHGEKVRLKGLDLAVSFVQNRIESQFTEIQPFDLMPRSARRTFVGIGKFRSKSVEMRVSEKDENLTTRGHEDSI